MKIINSKKAKEERLIKQIQKQVAEAFRKALNRKIGELEDEGQFPDPSLPKRK